jgi:hypothetical protein
MWVDNSVQSDAMIWAPIHTGKVVLTAKPAVPKGPTNVLFDAGRANVRPGPLRQHSQTT